MRVAKRDIIDIIDMIDVIDVIDVSSQQNAIHERHPWRRPRSCDKSQIFNSNAIQLNGVDKVDSIKLN